MSILTIGTRIYNNGDMANPSHFGTIIQVTTDKYGMKYKIREDETGKEYWVESYIVSETYSGTHATRIVTETEYDRWRKEQIKAFINKKFGV